MATILITGANRGIGLELTRRYAASGHQVIACCRPEADASELDGLDNVRVCRVSVSEAESVAALKGELGDTPIDVLVNNAGTPGPAPELQSAQRMDYDGWMEAFAVNTMAPLRMVQTFRDNLKAGGARKAITITSQMGALDLNWPVMYAYCSSKAAVNKVMRMLSADLAKDGIAVALIHPGHVKTDMGGPNAAIEVGESAAGIMSVIDALTLEDTGCFRTWTGEAHNW
jgi:NAD(P)-dependent dehydrogenase (short-subunit alcohol dehydrogenase family)